MFELEGRYGIAKIFADSLEETVKSQIIQLLNHPIAKNAHIRIMPDAHAGLGCVIGLTAKITNMVIPNLIGVDIGCGVLVFVLKSEEFKRDDFVRLDNVIKKNIPSSNRIRSNLSAYAKKACMEYLDADFDLFQKRLYSVSSKTNQNIDYVLNSLGTLGGGNHFIELAEDNDNLYLVVHSGSRNFGLNIAKYHQRKAKKKAKTGVASGLEYLVEDDMNEYVEDMKLAQLFARINRYAILSILMDLFFFDKPKKVVESIHNYIDFNDRIMRKGAISAHKEERVVIPLNMAEGFILGAGLGNSQWNYSAPHGAGRTMSRRQAKNALSVADFKSSMKGVFSTCINKSTIDESPMAYKSKEYIIKHIKETVQISSIVKPIYNFKAV